MCGLANRATAEMDRTRETCGILDEEMVSCEIGLLFGVQTRIFETNLLPWKGARVECEDDGSHEVRDQATARVGEQIPGVLGKGVVSRIHLILDHYPFLLIYLQRELESATDAAKTGSASASVISAASSAPNRGPPEAEKSNGSVVKFETREEEEVVEELKGLKV